MRDDCSSNDTAMHATPLLGSSWLPMACWILAFPGYFIYNSSVQLGLISSFLGGGSTVTIAASLLLLARSYLRITLRGRKNSGSHVPGVLSIGPLFWAFLAVFALATLIGLACGADTSITYQLFAYILKFAGLYVLAMLTPWEGRAFLYAAGVAQLVLFVFVVENSNAGAYLVNSLKPMAEDDPFDYQALAVSYLVVSLAAGYATKPVLLRWCQWLIALYGIFLIGARSEFVGMVFSIGLIEVARKKILSDYLFFASFPVIFLSAVLVIGDFSDIDSRMFGLFEPSADESVIARMALNASAWETILDNPIFGDFASYAPGAYAHNILSAWVDLGIIGFLLLLILLIGSTSSIVLVILRTRDSFSILALGCLGICVLLLIFAKAYFYQLIPVAMGIYTRAVSSERKGIE